MYLSYLHQCTVSVRRRAASCAGNYPERTRGVELIGKVTEVFKLLAVEAVLENIGSDILIGIEDGHTIDIMENSAVQTKVKEECLIEMGIKFEKEDGEPSSYYGM